MSRQHASQSKLIKSVQELALKLLSFLSTDLELNFAFSYNMLFLGRKRGIIHLSDKGRDSN